jgi:hypothetical protein
MIPFVILFTGAVSLNTAAWAQSAKPTQAPPAPPAAQSAPSVLPTMAPPVQAGPARATTPPAVSNVVTPVQATQAPAAPVAVTPRPSIPPAIASSWQNVALEFTITDTFGSSPTKKTVSMLVVDHGTGRIRSSTQIKVQQGDAGGSAYATITINIDATVTLSPSRTAAAAQRAGLPAADQIMLALTVQYTPDVNYQASASSKPASLDESLNIVLQDGKRTLVSQSADPQGDRKVTLEVMATVVK